jgi:Flp pilus assembly protein TadG
MLCINRRLWRGGQDDRGGVAVLVGVLLGGGVLLGVAALTIDVGQLHAERRQLQNGADAAAFAVAQGCIKAAATCDGSTAQGGTAATYADANAADGLSGVTVVCGAGPAAPLAGCPAEPANLTGCHSWPVTGIPASTNYIEVRTQTLTKSGQTLLPPTFAGALAGNKGYQGTTVAACSRVAWGPATNVPGLAVTFSGCEWFTATKNGTQYAPSPPYPKSPWPPSGLAQYEQIIKLKSKNIGQGICPSGPPGYDEPGAFGWLNDTLGNCNTSITGGTYRADPGNAANTCSTLLAQLTAAGAAGHPSVVYLPVYSSATSQGSNTTYTLLGFAAFVLTGYHVPGATGVSWLTGTAPCFAPDTCISGYFTKSLVTTGGTIGSGPDLGADVVVLAG